MPSYDQQSLDALIQQLRQQFAQNGGSSSNTAASVSPAQVPGIGGAAAAGGQFLGQIGDLINSGNPRNVSTTPVASGVNAGLDAFSAVPGPQQPFAAIAALIAPFIESFIPQGVPRDAKTQAIASALSSSPNQLQGLIGGLLQRGLNNNQVLSEGGPNTLGGAVERSAGMLEALTGQQVPGVTGTGDFQHDPTLNFTKMFKAIRNNPLPAGYEFVQDPTAINNAFRDISQMVGTSAPTTRLGESGQWQALMQKLISQNILQRYKGSLGAPVGGSALGSSGIPNVGLPHPLLQNQGAASAPYPV